MYFINCKLLLTVAIVVSVIAAIWVGEQDLQEVIKIDRTYCQMVKIYQTSHGVAGWPDYKKSYEKTCVN